MKEIKFSKLNITDKSSFYIKKILKSGWLTHGRYTDLFEKKFKEFVNCKYVLTVSSCTAGLHLSFLAAGIKKGDDVIVPSMSHTATSHAVEYTGARVKFADVDLSTGNLSISNIKKVFTKKTKAIAIVHMTGFSCDMKSISDFCKKNKIILIEDCAHSLGTTYNKTHVGNFGLVGAFSFYPTKQITTGEGGMITTNNKIIYEKIKSLKAFGIDKDIKSRSKPGHYDVKALGLNYRMTDFQAAMGYDQIINYRKNLEKRKKIAIRYEKNFKQNSKIKFVPFQKESSYFVFQIFVKNRNKLIDLLKSKKVGFSIHYAKALPEMTYYKRKYNLSYRKFLNSRIYAKTNISLPVYPKLTFSEVDRISSLVNNFYK